MKICTRCTEELTDSEFYKDSRAKSGFSSACKLCLKEARDEYRKRNPDEAKNYHLTTKYGITVEDRNFMLLSQGGRCAVCYSNKHNGRYWHMDHNHETNELRGLLCQYCNQTLGLYEKGWDVEIPAFEKYLSLYG